MLTLIHLKSRQQRLGSMQLAVTCSYRAQQAYNPQDLEPTCSRHHKRTKRGVFQGQEAGEGSHRGIIVKGQTSALVCKAARCKVVLDALRLDVVCDVCAVCTQGAAQWSCTHQTSGLDCHDHVHAASCAVKHAGCQSALDMPDPWQRTVSPFRQLLPW